MFDIIVIGGGPSGVTAALRAAELGANVALVERGNMGGTCTNDGCVPTRVLAKAARFIRDAEQFGDYGISVEKPTVDFARLLERTQEIVYRVHEKKQLRSHLEEAGVSLFANAGEAHFVDKHAIAIASGEVMRGDRFIICAGGHPRLLLFPGSELARTHSNVWSLRRLPRSLVVVGGAATGCQLASIFAAFGTRVWLLDVAPRLLGAEDEAVSQAIAEGFRRRGIEIITGTGGVERIEQGEGGLRLSYTYKGQPHALEADEVILAVGWPGNLEPLNLPAAGVETERGYIRVDDTLRTSAPNIFAAGDITGRMMLVQSGIGEGGVAAENAALGTQRAYIHKIVPHGGFTDPEYASVGLSENQARSQGDCAVAIVPYADLDRAVIDGVAEGFCKVVASRESRQVLGAHVVGRQAMEIVQIVAAAMEGEMTVDQLAGLEFAYPTFNSIVGLAARRIRRDLDGESVELIPTWGTLYRGTVEVEWERSEAQMSAE